MPENRNTISELRAMMFDQMRDIRDPTKALDMQRQRALVDVATVIINSAKVEVDYAAVMKGSMEMPFLEATERDSARDPDGTPVEPKGILESGPSADHPWRSSVHRLKG